MVRTWGMGNPCFTLIPSFCAYPPLHVLHPLDAVQHSGLLPTACSATVQSATLEFRAYIRLFGHKAVVYLHAWPSFDKAEFDCRYTDMCVGRLSTAWAPICQLCSVHGCSSSQGPQMMMDRRGLRRTLSVFDTIMAPQIAKMIAATWTYLSALRCAPALNPA